MKMKREMLSTELATASVAATTAAPGTLGLRTRLVYIDRTPAKLRSI